MTRDDTVTLATFSSMMHEADKLSNYPCRKRYRTSGDASNTSPMTRTVSRLVIMSHITRRLMEYFQASQTTRTRPFDQCTRSTAAIIQSRDSRGSQSDFIHSRPSRRTRDACEAADLVTRVIASLTARMTQSPLNSSYKLSLIDTLW